MSYKTRLIAFCLFISACQEPTKPAADSSPDSTMASPRAVRLITLDPGHFHAALVQKSMYGDIDSVVHVYAPAGPDVQSHLDKINGYNARVKDPTHWIEKVYTGNDFLQKMISDKAGNTVMLAGNNREKTSYILQSLQAGFHVLGDKPMVIDDRNFEDLQRAFDTAAAHKRILYDIMTERYEITSILQRELSMDTAIFGVLKKGSASDPAIVDESVHRWYKYVSGNVLTRPAWFFDVSQQGEGIVDVMTHLVDLVQWTAYPDQLLDYKKDITVNSARHWTTDLTLSQFKTITKGDSFPGPPTHDTVLKVYANGQIDYQLRGNYIRTIATWTYKAPEGADDTYSSLMKGSKTNLIIAQGPEQHYHSTLYIEPVIANPGYEQTLAQRFQQLQAKYPGISLKKEGKRWEVIIPDNYKEGHEAHFARVTEKFLGYVKNNDMPAWEVPGIITKYYITTKGLELARKKEERKDTLIAQVSTHITGSTRDLSLLDARVHTLKAGKTSPEEMAKSDRLLIVKDGSMTIRVGSLNKTLGPGGIALLPVGIEHSLTNTGSIPVNYYAFSFSSYSGTAHAASPTLLDWKDMPMKTTDKGESRQIFNQSVGFLSRIDMHATTLNEGQVSHPPHIHRNEEIILLRSGDVQMYIGGKYYPAHAGDIVFLTSGTPHALENKTKGRCEYFALQWQP